MVTKDKIISQLKDNFDQISEFGVIKIGLFGSFSNNSANHNSDIDILVKFSPESISFNNYMDLKFFLEDLFHTKIDLVIEDDLRNELKDSILSSVIYAA